jgi:putative endonuclease
MYYIYIIYSESADKYYVGYSQDYLRRLHEHNHSPRLGFTAKHRPWTLKAVFQCGYNESTAVQIERFIKRQKSRKLMETLIKGESLTGVLAQLVRVPHLRD